MIRWGVLGVSLVALLGAVPVAAQLPAIEAQCRLKAGTAYRAYGRALALRATICHRNRMAGKLPLAIVCDDPATWSANGFGKSFAGLLREQERLRATVNSCSPDILTPASLGYVACPAPCGAVTITTFDDLAACLQCLTDDCVQGAVQTTYGAPPVPIAKPPRKCQERVGRDLVIYYNKLSKTEHICQFRKDLNKHNYVGIDCTDFSNPLNPLSPNMARARAKLELAIAKRCAGVDFTTELDSCGVDVPSEQACLQAAVEQCTGALFDAAYPPVP